MTVLPKAYMRIARELTGYWGTYLPSLALEPGTIGRKRDGVFIKEGHVQNLAGYDRKRHIAEKDPPGNPVNVWTTNNVRLDVLGASASAPVADASGRIRLRFGGANEAAIICNGASHWSFAELRHVKELMVELARGDAWDKDQIVVTEVMVVSSAWICFATEKDQTAEIKASAALALPGDPIAALEAIEGKASLEASAGGRQSAGYTTTLPEGGTPLFQAIGFKRSWWPFRQDRIDYTKKSGSTVFEEPDFGLAGET